MKGSIMAARPARASERLDGRRVGRVDPAQHLAAVEPVFDDGPRVVRREPVVEFEYRALQAAAVHRAEDHLAVERAEQQQVLDHVRRTEHAVDAGTTERRDETPQQLAAVRHGQRIAAHAQCPARRMVGRDQHQPAAVAHQRSAHPPQRRIRDRTRIVQAHLA
jgi:hypothetical protein